MHVTSALSARLGLGQGKWQIPFVTPFPLYPNFQLLSRPIHRIKCQTLYLPRCLTFPLQRASTVTLVSIQTVGATRINSRFNFSSIYCAFVSTVYYHLIFLYRSLPRPQRTILLFFLPQHLIIDQPHPFIFHLMIYIPLPVHSLPLYSNSASALIR